MFEFDCCALGRRIAEARKARGLSRKQAAKLIGVSLSVLRYWENGNRTPTAYSLCLICKAYEVSADWLLGIRTEDKEICGSG